MNDHPDWELLDRYFAGECTPGEAAEVRQRLETDDRARAYLDALRSAMELRESPGDSWDTDSAWARLAGGTGIEPRPEAEPPLRLVGRGPARDFALRSASPLIQVAAALALLAGGAGAWWAIARTRAVAPAEVAMREYATTRGERAETRLGDGTRVLLGAESRLRIPADFGRRARTVHLEGEAYFEVTHDSTQPFAVHARNAVALDLGTRFGVRAYGDEARVQVVVAEGKVALGPAGAPAGSAPVLAQGELGRLDSSGTTLVVRGVDLEQYLGWTEGQLVFRGTPLREAAAEIGRWHDIEIRLASQAIGEKQLTASFQDEPVAEVLRVVAVALDLGVKQEGRVVMFGPK